jgi:hypothetical protein
MSTEKTEDDWRLHLTVRLSEPWTSPWSGETSPVGTRITLSSVVTLSKKKQITIPIPNATALMLSAAEHAYNSARKIRDQCAIDKSLHQHVAFQDDAQTFDYLEGKVVSIVLAYTAIEAFVNEVIPEDFSYTRTKRDGSQEQLNKSVIERHVNMDEKLCTVLPSVLSCLSPKGSRCWQAYRQLKEIRDRVVHMKTEDRKSSGPEVETIWKGLLLMPAPQVAAKGVIDHFVRAMENAPQWHQRYAQRKK